MNKIKLLITDDHTLLRESFVMLLNADDRLEVVADCGSGEEAIELASLVEPDVVLMDINLPGMDGFETTTQLVTESPGIKVLAVSLHTQPAYVRKLLKLGALGYITKNSPAEEMTKAIVAVHEGRKYICEEIKTILANQELAGEGTKGGLCDLSGRELDIIRYLKNGFSSKEIALSIGLHLKTVQVHRYNILHKLNVPNVAAMINYVNHSQLAADL